MNNKSRAWKRRQDRLIKANPVAKALNMVTKPATMEDKKKEQSKTYCRKEKKYE
jgi:hypothetical protein